MAIGTRRRLTGLTIVLVCAGIPATVLADPGGEGGGKPVTGARSLGDPLLPQLGNGGYDVEHYTIELDYDPVANRFDQRDHDDRRRSPRRSSASSASTSRTTSTSSA